jgi:hypothetical protein
MASGRPELIATVSRELALREKFQQCGAGTFGNF